MDKVGFQLLDVNGKCQPYNLHSNHSTKRDVNQRISAVKHLTVLEDLYGVYSKASMSQNFLISIIRGV